MLAKLIASEIILDLDPSRNCIELGHQPVPPGFCHNGHFPHSPGDCASGKAPIGTP